MSDAVEKYEELIESSEQTVRDALGSLDSMVQYFEQLNTNLHQLLEINPKIDNTGIR